MIHVAWRRRMVAALLGACVMSMGGVVLADDAASTQPSAALPWAVRRTGDKTLLILKDSSLAVPIPAGSIPGDIDGTGGFGPADMSYDIAFTVTPGDKADADTATAAANATAKQWAGTIADKSLVVDPTVPAQVKLVISAMGHQTPVVVRQKVVDGQLVTAVVVGAHDKEVPAEAIAAAGAALDAATTVERKPVHGHEEVGNSEQGGPGANRHGGSEGDNAGAAGGRGSRHAPAATPSASSSDASSSYMAQQNTWAAAALAAAKKLQAGGNDVDAYEKYQYILQAYPKSDSAKAAQDAVTAYEANADLMAKINGKGGATSRPSDAAAAAAPVDPAAKAASLLSLGESYLTANQPDLARKKFQAIVDQYGDTPSAAAAKQHLADLDNAGR